MKYFILAILCSVALKAQARCVDISGRYEMKGPPETYELQLIQTGCASVKSIRKFNNGKNYEKIYYTNGAWVADSQNLYSERFYLTAEALVSEIAYDCKGNQKINKLEYILQSNGDIKAVTSDWDWSCSKVVVTSRIINKK